LVASGALVVAIGNGCGATAPCGAAAGPPGTTSPTDDAGPDASPRPPEQIAADSPFGIYSPLGEALNDGQPSATPQAVVEHLRTLGAKWVQELPFGVALLDVLPGPIGVYGRVGREAGMSPQHQPWNAYETQVRGVVRGASARIKLWEVDTEPDGVGGWAVAPAAYARLLRVTRDAIKSECADCTVFFGGLSGWSERDEPQVAGFLDRVLREGAVGAFDGVEIKFHHVAASEYRFLRSKLDSTAAVLAKHGLDIASMPVVVETAMHDGDPRTPETNPLEERLPVQSEAQQAAGLVKTFVFGIAIGLRKLFWNFVHEANDFQLLPGQPPRPQNPFNHYGLVHNPANADGLSHAKLSYSTYRKMVETLEGSEWRSVKTLRDSADGCVFELPRGGKRTWVAWTDSDAGGSVRIASIATEQVTVIDAVPAAESGKEVTDYATAFKARTLDVAGGAVDVALNPRTPVYIVEP
jgi:hypothetical protein